MVGTIVLIFVFILIGGFFAAAEMALVSLRDAQVAQVSQRGKRGAAVARLAASPNRYLSAVQIGVTVSGFLSAAFGGESLGGKLAPVFVRWGLPEAVAAPLSLVLVTVVIAFFTIVLSELAAKRIAMQRAEQLALALAPVVDFIATLCRPVIWLLGVATNLVVRLLGGDPRAGREAVTDEEIRAMVVSSSTLGDEERAIVDEVFAAGELSLREVMVPRTEVDFLPGDMPAYRAVRELQGSPHSRYPVTNGSADEIAGFLHVRDLMDLDVTDRSTPVAQLARPVLELPETVRVLKALSEMRKSAAHLAIVRDEYGGTAGIVTMEDLVEELIGDITDEFDEQPAAGHDLDDLDGLTTIEEFAEESGLAIPDGPYDTVAGFVLAQLGRVPRIGDEAAVGLLPVAAQEDAEPVTATFAVTALDGRRIARVSVRR